MTIDKAIEQLTRWVQHPPGVVFSNELDAAKLGIEALKRVKRHQDQYPQGYYELLLGETDGSD